jgi:tetratricopeptide (TPR) repeat protein
LAARADLCAGQRNYEAALRDYAAALRLCPERTQYHRGRANVYKAMNKPEEAFQDLVAVVEKIGPENVSVWRDLGDLLAGAGKLKEAVFALKRKSLRPWPG